MRSIRNQQQNNKKDSDYGQNDDPPYCRACTGKGSSHYGNEIYDVLEVPLPKNLFLVNKKSKHYMLMLHAEKNFVSKKVAHMVGSSRMSFGSPESWLN